LELHIIITLSHDIPRASARPKDTFETAVGVSCAAECWCVPHQQHRWQALFIREWCSIAIQPVHTRSNAQVMTQEASLPSRTGLRSPLRPMLLCSAVGILVCVTSLVYKAALLAVRVVVPMFSWGSLAGVAVLALLAELVRFNWRIVVHIDIFHALRAARTASHPISPGSAACSQTVHAQTQDQHPQRRS